MKFEYRWFYLFVIMVAFVALLFVCDNAAAQITVNGRPLYEYQQEANAELAKQFERVRKDRRERWANQARQLRQIYRQKLVMARSERLRYVTAYHHMAPCCGHVFVRQPHWAWKYRRLAYVWRK